MILEIEGIMALITGVFMLFSIYEFLHYFNKDRKIAMYRIKLSENAVWYFILLLSANFILMITYALASGLDGIKYGIMGVIAYTVLFAFFFLHFSYVIKGKNKIV